jgi:protease-4
MAASGGYYLACAAHKIVAQKTSIVGSIGVVGGKIVLDEALAKLGVNAYTLAASPEEGADLRAAYLSPLAPWNDEIRERLGAQIDSVYQLFMKRVSKGRGLTVAQIRKIAEGRVWSGTQGLEHKLVDEMGGLSRALAVARKLAELDDETPVRVEGSGESLLETLLLGDDAEESQVRTAIERLEARQARVLGKLSPRLRPFVGSLQPLLDGETVLAAVPMAAWIE